MRPRITDTRTTMFGAAARLPRDELVPWLKAFAGAEPVRRPLESTTHGRMQIEAKKLAPGTGRGLVSRTVTPETVREQFGKEGSMHSTAKVARWILCELGFDFCDDCIELHDAICLNATEEDGDFLCSDCREDRWARAGIG